ncbi:hypothetical protein JQ594_15530 [Bradyrhizobium manausense]|uniref:hypothetical protein n=1 Tax=Bradyrhizobium manausense TaxID=989370 RepID=UPI001BA516F1|nr:hypothetical protein [Bradyrhizobium manausense]MBR0687342.1 hypothetical protein [Bradyrhizobium manausense]
MTEDELKRETAKLRDAIERDDEKAGKEATLAIAEAAVGSWLRIAAALEHIASNLPAK